MRRRELIAGILLGISLSILGASVTASGAVRLDRGADLQADAETVRHIEEVFNRAEEAIREKGLDALTTVYSEHYRYQDLTKADMRKIWQGFFEHYDRISALHSFSRILMGPGTSHGRPHLYWALWATMDQTDQRVNLSIGAEDIHHMMYEEGAWKISRAGTQCSEPARIHTGPTAPFLGHVRTALWLGERHRRLELQCRRNAMIGFSYSEASHTARRRADR